MSSKKTSTLHIGLGSDHAGYEYKQLIKAKLSNEQFALTDFGTHSTDSVDYPDFAHPLAAAVASGELDYGILICGSANGVAITANKHQAVRAAICWQTELAQLARQHNNANVLCIPARFVTIETAFDMVAAFLQSNFEGGRHNRRVQKIAC